MLIVVRLGHGEGGRNDRLSDVLSAALDSMEYRSVPDPEALPAALVEARGTGSPPRVLFAVCLPPSGVSFPFQRMLAALRTCPDLLDGCAGAVLMDGCGELYTKAAARSLLFAASGAGCTFPGRPLVEATGSLRNFETIGRIRNISGEKAYRENAADLVRRLQSFVLPDPVRPAVLALHSGSRPVSNTLLAWDMVKKQLAGKASVEELSLRDGAVVDCRGCSYETCLHFGEQGSCFYGGVIVEQVYPALLRCNVLVLICPNYNDAVSASFNAFFNRLTALFRNNPNAFGQKKVYALVVSGYSGGELVAEQILDALCCNKGFILPAHFALLETANDPGSILRCPSVGKKADGMAAEILGTG